MGTVVAELRLGRVNWLVAVVVTLLNGAVGLASLASLDDPLNPGLRTRPAGDSTLLVTRVTPGTIAWTAGLRPGDVVAARTVPEGSEAFQAYEVLSGSRASQLILVDQPWSEASDVAFFLLGLEFLGTGLAVYLLASDRQAAIRFLVLAGATAITMFVTPANGAGYPWAIYFGWVGVNSVGAAMAFFFLTVPVERWSPLRRAILGLLPPLVALYTYTFFFNPALYDTVKPLGFLYLTVGGSVSVAALAWPFVTRTSSEERRLRAVLVCTGLAVGLFVLGSLAPYLLFGRYWLPPAVAVLGWALLPVGFCWAILQRQLFGFAVAIRRTLVYSAMALGVALAIYGLTFVAYRSLAPERPEDATWSSVTTLFFLFGCTSVALICFLMHGRITRLVDSLVYGDHYDYVQTVRGLGQRIAATQPIDQVLDDVVQGLARTMNLVGVAVLLNQSGGLALRALSGDCPGVVDRARGRRPPGRWLPLVAQGQEQGLLYLGPKRALAELSATDLSLAEAVADQLAIAVTNTLLVEQLGAQVATLRAREEELERVLSKLTATSLRSELQARELAALSARLITAEEETRRRIALELHDDPLQRILLVVRGMRSISLEELTSLPPEQLRETARGHLQTLEEVATSLRAITRELRPPALDDLGLGAALEWLLSDVQLHSDLAVDLVLRPEEFGRLDPALELALYRVVQEALNNVLKHAEAKIAVVTLRRDEGLWLEVADDGRGLPTGPQSIHSLGLVGMRERLRPWNGEVSLANRPGSGAVLTVMLPSVPSA